LKNFVFFSFLIAINSYALTFSCPLEIMGEENRDHFDLDIGPPDKRLHGPAFFRIDNCIFNSTETAVVAHVDLWFNTDAVFTWKKKVLGVKVTKNFDLDCKFQIITNASFEKGCSLQYADVVFQKFRCHGIPKVFTKMFESKIQNLLNLKVKELLSNNLEDFVINNDEARKICL
jgi:hypothetical protein